LHHPTRLHYLQRPQLAKPILHPSNTSKPAIGAILPQNLGAWEAIVRMRNDEEAQNNDA